jgi:hypothetical protein
MKRLLDFAGNQAAWWWCVLCVRAGHAGLALFGPAAYVGVHAALRPSGKATIAALGATAAAIGFVADSMLVRTGYLGFPGGRGPWTAAFMVALWGAFGVSLTASMRFLGERPAWVAAAVGALAGPVAYASGERLGVLVLAPHAWVAVAVVWAAAVAALAALARRTEGGAT